LEVVIQKQEQNSITQLDTWSLYLYAMKSPVTRLKYQKRLAKFLECVGLTGITTEEKARAFAENGSKDVNWAFGNILKFVQYQLDRVNRKEITAATLRNYVKSIKLFCDMADLQIPWKKITRGLPKERRYASDRAPTIEEIKKIMEYPDRRIKAIVLVMSSSGIRLGSWDYLKWANIIPIKRGEDNVVVAAKIIVYAGEEDEYFSFMTPEAYQALADWMEYREKCGEIITKDSWLMRDLWDVSKPYGKGLVTRPKKLASLGVKRLMEKAIWAQVLRKKLENGKKRHPFQANHSLRKWFKTRCEISGMLPINVEMLLSHETGISDSYYRPTENDLLQSYLKTVDMLTINGDKLTLQKQVAELTERSKDNEYIIRGKLQEKDEEMRSMKQQVDTMQSQIKSLMSTFSNIQEQPKLDTIAKTLYSSGLIKAATNNNKQKQQEFRNIEVNEQNSTES
jgi:integrase